MNPIMRAMLQVTHVDGGQTNETITFSAVCTKPFGPDGESEENTFARWTPSASLQITITNSELFGKLQPGAKFYVDFTPVADQQPQSSPAEAPTPGNGDDTSVATGDSPAQGNS